MLTRCAVVGHPVSHSLSPAIHRAAYAELGLDWTYERIDLAPGDLPSFVAGRSEGLRGLSVTMPHKLDAARLGMGDEVVERTGVANTLVFTPTGVIARNTDVSGYLLALRAHGVTELESVIVVGNGATARSAVVAAARAGARDLTVCCRSVDRAAGVLALAEGLGMTARAQSMGAEPLPADLVVSTVPGPALEGVAESLVGSGRLIFDSSYDPWPTPLATTAAAAGRMVLNGLDLLAGQAVDQVRWFTGRSISFETARRAAAQGRPRS